MICLDSETVRLFDFMHPHARPGRMFLVQVAQAPL